jgi:apolipoprotein N-acyltransferase
MARMFFQRTPSIPILQFQPMKFSEKLLPLFAGILFPFGYAPFHYSGVAILSVALFFLSLKRQHANSLMSIFSTGFFFGVGSFGIGVSWIYVSIYTYGHLPVALSALITCLFILYLSCFPGLLAISYGVLSKQLTSPARCCLLFSVLWPLMEFLRSTHLTGFPWLLLGYSQMDSPLCNLLPLIGIYGTSFITCLAATFLSEIVEQRSKGTARQAYISLLLFVLLLIAPVALQNKSWTKLSSPPLSVAVIQANVSMRDKWDESLFWNLVNYYRQKITTLSHKNQLIVLPESAIPVPADYLLDVLSPIDRQAKKNQNSILLGIPKPSDHQLNAYYNTMTALGAAKGTYLKQHLAPFGEYTPSLFHRLCNWLSIPIESLIQGPINQPLIHIQHHPIASLICYEIAYPSLLRQQLPRAEWIVSISDDGWFGHSLAMPQHLQMAQALSMQTGRYQVIANNDGLSSVIDDKGRITASLPAFSAGVLESSIHPASGSTPWVYWGDTPFLLLMLFLLTALGLAPQLSAWRLASQKSAVEIVPSE